MARRCCGPVPGTCCSRFEAGGEVTRLQVAPVAFALPPRLDEVDRELEEFVQKTIESGLYGSAREVVREALRLLARRDAAHRPGGLLLEGLDSGEVRERTADDWREARATVRERLARHG